MARTDDQKAADEQVTAALENWLRAYELDGSTDKESGPRVLTDYVVFMATQGFTQDGDTITGHPYILRDMAMPLYRALGLVHVGTDLLASTMEDDDE